MRTYAIIDIVLVIYIWMHACIYAPWGTNTPWPIIISIKPEMRERERNAQNPMIHGEVEVSYPG